MNKIIIYTSETCPYCQQVKDELTKNNIKFKERLTKDWQSDWQSITNATNMPNVPTIVYKNNYFAPGRDFRNAQHLVHIINEFKESKLPIEIQNLEKVKTLTYNIQVAFGTMDQILKRIENKLNIEENEHKSTS